LSRVNFTPASFAVPEAPIITANGIWGLTVLRVVEGISGPYTFSAG
jgi:hypothetical protein